MKKLWCFFWIMTALGALGVCVTAVLARAVFWAAVVLGAAAWTVFFFRFRSIGYAVEKDRLIIRGGVLIRTERNVKKTDILWTTAVRIGSVTLFSVIHTAAARVVVFAEIDRNVFAF